MKKIYLGIILIGMAHVITAQDLSLREKKIREHTEMLQKGKYGRAALKGAAIGAPVGGVTLGVAASGDIREDPTFGLFTLADRALKGTLGAAGGATAGAALAVAYRFGLRNWQLRKINSAIEKYTLLSQFQDLTAAQAMLFVAAYKRNIPVMRVLIERQPEFVNQKGVWKALAYIFTNQKPTSTQVERLQNQIHKEE